MSATKARLSEKLKSLEELFLFQNTYWNLVKKIEEDLNLWSIDVKYEDFESLTSMFRLKSFSWRLITMDFLAIKKNRNNAGN